MKGGIKKSEIRKDYFLDKYTIITPGRSQRPRDIVIKEEAVKDISCPLCDPATIRRALNIIHLKNDKIITVKNIFPAVSLDNPAAYGTQEVIIETKKHQLKISDMSVEHIEAILKMFAHRTERLSHNKKINYILCFKNYGSNAGASIAHQHSQIFATEILPPEVERELLAAKQFQNEHHICPYCQIIKKELKSPRLIMADKNIIALAPYASQYHYEAWILPKRHLDNITDLSKLELKSCAQALKHILGKIEVLGLAYNFFLHQIVSDHDQHFFIKIEPRTAIWAGVELGSGLVINSVSPEAAASYYKK